MIRPLSLFALLVAPVWLISQSPPTPPTLIRTEAGTCPRCTLKLEYVATVGSADDKELMKESHDLLRLRGGGFIAWGAGLMQLYDAKGKYLRTVGKLGDGPGEYRGGNAATNARGDSVLLYAYGKTTVLSVATGKGRSERSLTRQSAFRVLSFGDGSVLAQNYAGAPGAFIVMAPDGTLRKAFGAIGDSVMHPNGRKGVDYDSQQWGIAPSTSGGFWAVKFSNNFALERWSADGEVQQVIGHRPTWFPPYTYEAKMTNDQQGVGNARPLTRMVGLWSDAKEQLFTLAITGDQAWKRDPKAAPAADGRKEAPRPSLEPTGGFSRYVDGIYAAYDGKTGSLLGSWRSDEWVGLPIGDGFVAARKQSEDGVLSYQVWRVVLSGR